MGLTQEINAYSASLAAELKRRRLVAGLSLTMLAEKSGLSRPMVGYVEQGVRLPTVETLARLAAGLNTTASEILAAVERKKPL